MAGRGPAPKDPSKRSRRNADPVATRVIEVSPDAQPRLPELMPSGEPWPARTGEWWQMWADSPLSNEFTLNDWSELLDSAVLHGEYWSGNVKVAAELRLRVAKFGATPEDRARLRITFAQPDEADERRTGPASSSRDRRGPLKAV
ncbi:terminase small subunit [Gordonia phage Birdsong]